MNLKKPKFWDQSKLSLSALLLYPISLSYLLIASINKLFKVQKKFQIPIVCIGNIYIGGTGKTPLAIEMFNILKSIGKNPGFVKKYYDYLDDEIKMLKKAGTTFLSKNRTKAIDLLIKNKNDIAILDDGFQDFSIKKNFSILCFNSKQWIGNGHTIPSGPLREKLSSIRRADCIVINEKKFNIEEKINNLISKDIQNNKLKIFYSKYKIVNLDKIKTSKVIAFAGIGNPSNFFDLLKENNVNLIKTYSFPDHYNYSNNEIDKMYNESKLSNAHLITTEKDYFRMNEELKEKCQFVKVALELEKKDEFKEFVKKFL